MMPVHPTDSTTLSACRRAFYDKRLAQEVEGEALGDVRPRRLPMSNAPLPPRGA